MPRFQWEGFDGSNGRPCRGEMDAELPTQVTEALLVKGIHIQNIQEAAGHPLKTVLDHSKRVVAPEDRPAVAVPKPWDAPKPGLRKAPPPPEPSKAVEETLDRIRGLTSVPAIEAKGDEEFRKAIKDAIRDAQPGLSGMPAAEAEIADLRAERSRLLAQVAELEKKVDVYKKLMTPLDEEGIQTDRARRASKALSSQLEIIELVIKQAKGKIKAAAMDEIKEALVKRAILNASTITGI